jgi:cyclomaltodextrinase
MLPELKLGIYEHFKGGKYEVIGFAKDSETLEKMVLYKHLGEDEVWVRPLKMFMENVERDGKIMPRFKHV